ncbi:MAG: NAD-dependent epimerase/dehydratase family protein [Acidobacteriaceae bacterium]|nr:NAD-dependent epimerase/dehydratase family protein [Acidobacteriaceae bacterium]
MSTDRKRYALVTGAAGFVGAHVVRELQNLNDVSVVALDDLTGGYQENLPGGIDFVKGSITDTALLARLFQKYNFRFIYHLAAYAAEGLSHFIRRFNYTNNLIGSINLINEAVKAESECFVFTSSIAVYGAIEPPMAEHKTPHPEDPYGISKLAVEMDLRCAHEMFGLNFVTFRPHNVYGEYQNLADPYRNVIGIFMKQILEDRPMTIFGDGTQQRAFSYVGDIAPAIASSPFVRAAQNEVFNIGADQPYAINDLAVRVAEAMGKPGHPVEHLTPRNEVLHAFSDHSKARSVFGSERQTSLDQGLARMARWARSVRMRPLEGFADIEVTKNMPPSWLKYKAQASYLS